ncbi:L-fucose:H+ symporter permease [Parvularcula sp. LCG005]|uniref:L-fucose:H+ symporter permease n=1 Tax=Parvularcula sp. LCG005 TaxID=3078805 RepID=UPI0029424C3E|nr:L-fucose:H+ symporter permease [Parvularcula sp. LCG005]WOI52163.1 L-fucose:H+ symporter permease [Parvularcula sp. LCG005]
MTSETGRDTQGRFLPAIILVFSLFLLWGIANSLNDILVPQFKKAFTLTDLQSSLVQSAFYFGYFVWAIPASLLMRRFGYKAGVIVGLVLFGCGALLFLPAAEARVYGLFLGALFVIASGLAFLETSANPLMSVLGSSETAARRLNFAQSFNSLGVIAGSLIGQAFILTGHEPSTEELAAMDHASLDAFRIAEAATVKGPYLVLALGVLALAVVAFLTAFPKTRDEEETTADSHVGVMSLLGDGRVMFGVLAQFLYVGAQVGIWSFLIRYGTYTIDGMGETAAAKVLTASFVAFMIGRFASTAVMTRVPAWAMLTTYALINVALCAVAVVAPGITGFYALAATSFFMSLMFPTIFALTLDGLGAKTKSASSLLVMAIIGGAVMAMLVGRMSDIMNINLAMSAPLIAFVGVAAFGWSCRRRHVVVAP